MQESAYFSQAEKNINIKLADRKYDEAHKICLSYIRDYPDERRFLKLKKKIEDAVTDENEKLINKRLSDTKIFWKEQKYAEILNTLRPLLKVAPHNEKLKKQILKAQEKYKKELDLIREKFNKEQSAKFNELMEKDEQQFIEELFLLEKNNPGNKTVQDLTRFFRNKLIEKKINEKTELIYSEKFEAIDSFISQLKKIDENNKNIKGLEILTNTREHGSQVSEKNEFIYKVEEHLDTLMRLKKYETAVKVAVEILDIDKKNEKVKKILKKAKKKFFKQTMKGSIDSIHKNMEGLKAEFQKDKNKFVKI